MLKLEHTAMQPISNVHHPETLVAWEVSDGFILPVMESSQCLGRCQGPMFRQSDFSWNGGDTNCEDIFEYRTYAAELGLIGTHTPHLQILTLLDWIATVKSYTRGNCRC